MLYEVDGYFVDDNSEFYGYVVKDSLDVVDEEDDDIFFYFNHAGLIRHAVETGEPVGDFVLTGYRPRT